MLQCSMIQVNTKPNNALLSFSTYTHKTCGMQSRDRGAAGQENRVQSRLFCSTTTGIASASRAGRATSRTIRPASTMFRFMRGCG